ncbi:MAG: GAF domain-containing protein [Thermoflexales bacterium]|nr:GAF domain-containing protein [Thermoflexales bacterium]
MKKAFFDRSLAIKTSVGLAIMLVLVIVDVAGAYFLVQQQRYDARVVNIAGRQRMLNQRMTQQAYLVSMGDANARSALSETGALYERSLKGLQNGDAELGLPPASPKLRAQLDGVAGLWGPFYAQVKVVQQGTPGSDEFQAAIAYIRDKNQALLDESDQSVTQFEGEAAQRVNTLLTFLFVSLGLAVAVFVAAWMITSRAIRPIVDMTALAARIAGGELDQTIAVSSSDETGLLAGAFNQMVAQLRETLRGLEVRVAERTRGMELAAEVARRLSTVRDLDKLLSESVELTRSSYALYYVQVYLAAAGGRSLVLRAGTGSVGAQLVARGHRLPVGPGSINGTAAASRRSVIVADTAHSATFRPNPLLPNTRSEMAVPLVVGERVVGVLNLQNDRPGSLTDERLPIFEALAGQLAIAIENAALFAQAEQARAETESFARRLTRQGWEGFMDALARSERMGYTFEREADAVKALEGDLPQGGNGHRLNVPIAVSGEPLGALYIEGEPEHHWSGEDSELVASVAAQVAQQVENLRLLAEAEQYRAEAEEAVRRTTREGWQTYIKGLTATSGDFVYDAERVRETQETSGVTALGELAVARPLTVRGETVGEVAILEAAGGGEQAAQLVDLVADRLSVQIETLRLLQEAELGRQQLDRRAADLQTVAEVSSRAATILDPAELLQNVVEMTKARFGLYHAHIYLLSEAGDRLNLAAGAGEAGRQMIEQGWHILLSREHSLVVRAARNRQGVIVNDVRAEPDFMPNPLLPETRSEMAIPMLSGERLVGVLDVQADSVDRFSQEDVNIKTTLVGQVASLLENVRLLSEVQKSTQELQARGQQLETQSRELERRSRELEASQQVTFAASEHITPEELLGLVVNLIRDQFDFYHVQVYLVDQEKQAAVLRESTGYAGRQLLKDKHQIPFDQPSLVSRVVNTGSPILVQDVSKAQDWLPNPLLPHTQAELVVPLKLEGNVLGVLDVQSRTTDQLTPASISLFQTMTDQVAFLFENSALLARVTEQTQALTAFTAQLRIAAEIAARLSAILDEDQLLREVVDLMQSRFGLYHAHVYLTEEAKGERGLVVRAGSGEVGRVLVERGHSIPLEREKSSVARAGRERHAVVVQDSTLDSDFMPNPLLPQTRSELAVPLVVGGQLLGVLDIQDDQPGRFQEADVSTLSTLTGQIATALQNARSFEAQKRAEQEIRELSRQSELVLSSAGEGIFGVDQDGVTTFVNPAAAEMLGWTTEELVGHRHHDLIHHTKADGSPYPSEECKVYAAYRDGKTHRGDDETYWRKDGTSFPVAYTSVPIRDEEGTILGAVVTFQDITERQRAEAETQKRAVELQTVAEITTAAATILDPQVLLQRVVDLTQANFDLYHAHIYLVNQEGSTLELAAGSGEAGMQMKIEGWKIDVNNENSLVALAFRDRRGIITNDVQSAPGFMPNPHLPETRSEMAIPMIVGERTLGVLDVQSNRLDRFTQNDMAIKTTLAGQVSTALENARLFEETRYTAERLQEVDKLKSEFLANMSHELRTPLNSIIGYSEVMLMGIDGELDPDTHEDVQAIYDNGKHLLNLINDILDLAKIEAGRLSLSFEEVDVESLLDDVKTNNMGLLLKSKKPVELQVAVEGEIAPIRADRLRLSQVLNNLVSNAVKFTEQGTVTLHASQEEGWVHIAVKDSGIGMSEADLAKIFQRFRQVDGSNKRRAEGTGLGLSITRYLVEMHGGSVDVTSQVGEGSTFTVHLPVAGPQEVGEGEVAA